MRTIYVSIGNSDDKLTQYRWSQYIREVRQAVLLHADKIHFFGFSGPDTWHQSAAWAAQFEHLDQEQNLGDQLKEIAGRYDQDSIAWAVLGEVTFIRP